MVVWVLGGKVRFCIRRRPAAGLPPAIGLLAVWSMQGGRVRNGIPVETMRRITIYIVAGLLTAWFTSSAFACLWDSDTLKQELRGRVSVLDAITGRVERNPPLYYEMRLERVAARLADDGDDLAAYDDAGVACDRLGRSDDAIEWMAKKRAALDRLMQAGSVDSEHEYRYFANLGTFYAHRWVRAGGDRQSTADLQRGCDLIEQAIAMNPDAHFGRERYQLMMMRWLLNTDEEEINYFKSALESGYRTAVDRKEISPDTSRDKFYGDAVEGLTGLILLGNAWESADVMHALADAIGWQRDTSVSRLAQLRYKELVGQGKLSLVYGGRSDKAIFSRLGELEDAPAEVVKRYFTTARVAADQWRENREIYMLARLSRGEHPDTHPAFWHEFADMPSRPDPPGLAMSWAFLTRWAPVVIAVVAVWGLIRVFLNRKRKPAST